MFYTIVYNLVCFPASESVVHRGGMEMLGVLDTRGDPSPPEVRYTLFLRRSWRMFLVRSLFCSVIG